MGKLYQTSLAPCGEGPGDQQLLNLKAKFFSACSKESRLWSKQRQLQMPLQILAPPIALPLPSTNQDLVSSTNHNPTSFFPPFTYWFHPFKKHWKHEPQINKRFALKEGKVCPTHPSHCPIYCPFPCQWVWALSWNDWKGMNSAQILPPFPKESWYVPVIQVHGFLWRPVLWSSCWVGGRGQSRGREPTLCEPMAHKSQVASAKMSALRMTDAVKLTNQATTWLIAKSRAT